MSVDIPAVEDSLALSSQLKRASISLMLLWTILILLITGVSFMELRDLTVELTRTQAATFNEDIAYRQWADQHSVYLLVKTQQQDNSILDGEPDVESPSSSKSLWRVNPFEEDETQFSDELVPTGYLARITSLKPMHPDNTPDAWERQALERLQAGQSEISEISVIDGSEYLRFMRPLITEKACLSCHGVQGYKVGDQRGGVSVSIPMEENWSLMHTELLINGLGFFLVWAMGIVGLGYSSKRFRGYLEEQERAETELKRTAFQLRAVVEYAYDWEYWISEKGELLHISPSCERVSGYPPEFFIEDPENLQRIVIEEDYPAWLKHVHPREEAMEARECQFRIQHADGRICWIEQVCRPVLSDSGSFKGYRASNRDVTERKQTEEDMRKLAQAVEQSAESIVITDSSAQIEYVNQAFLDQTGYEYHEVIGQNPKVLQSGKTPPETYTEMWETLSHGKSWKGKFWNRRKDGTEFIEFAMISPIMDSDGKVAFYVAAKEDITEKVRLGKELDDHRHHLEELVEERTLEAEMARKRAETASHAKSEFLANMSHEIRTPVNAIIGLTKLLQKEPLTEPQMNRLNKVDTAAEHLLSVINDILDISKIEAGKISLEQVNFRLDLLLEQVRTFIRESVQQKGLKLEISSDQVPNLLRGDANRLRQALLNYAVNAVKFTESGVISIRVTLVEEVLDTLLIRFEVQDTGIGISQSKINDLFSPFEQADTSTTRKYGGTGLGLAITRRLARLMGGETGAESKVGRGSTFWFTARLQPSMGEIFEGEAEKQDSESIIRSDYRGTHLLLVEDNPINAEVAEEFLSGAGLKIDLAENGRVALEKVETNDYDLVLMDVQMPEMDGLQATRLIRAIPERRELPILAMTANVFEEDRIACINAGMNDFIAKPIDPENMFGKILNWLSDEERPVEQRPDPDPDPEPVQQAEDKAVPETSAAPEPEETAPIESAPDGNRVIDFSALNKLFGDDVQKHHAILKKFVTQAADLVEEIRSAQENQDAQQVAFHAHKLKGSSRTVGAENLADLCYELEKAGKEGYWSMISSHMVMLGPTLKKVVEFVNEL